VTSLGIAGLMALSSNPIGLVAQGRGAVGGGGSSTSRVVSPAVMASWVLHQNYADGRTTTLLVLWRGTPGWFSTGNGQGGGGSSGAGGSGGSYGYVYLSQGGHTFTMEFDYDRSIVKMLDEEISLIASNVVLVDFVDSATGPTIVGSRWVDPATEPAAGDPIAAIIKRTPDLFDYLRCDVNVPNAAMNAMMALICGQMRP
jgi:hypothetical protein